jgi:hypothetical protein
MMGACIGLALGAVEGIVVGAWGRAAAGAGLGLLIGGAGGSLGGLMGQIVFSGLIHDSDAGGALRVIAARAIGWALVGAFVGLGPGLLMMAPRKLVNGILGGAAGGFVGGLLFDPLSLVFGMSDVLAGTPSRLVGIVVTGLCAGVGIGLVEEMRKEAWLLLISGPLAGKQFILYKPVTWIGNSSGMDIPLLKDVGVAPKQCRLDAGPSGHILQDLSGGGTYVNGEPVGQRRLSDGDVIEAGHTGLQYCTRPYAAGPHLP